HLRVPWPHGRVRMTVAARAIENCRHAAGVRHVCLNRTAEIDGRIRALGTYKLSDDECDDDYAGCLLQSSAHGSSVGPLKSGGHACVSVDCGCITRFPGMPRELNAYAGPER